MNKTTTELVATKKATPRTRTKAAAPVFFFQKTPTGPLLRAYFVALALAQTQNKFIKGRKFRLWPGANLAHHVDNNRVEAHGKSVYSFTDRGVDYFKTAKPASPMLLASMAAAVTSGTPPKDHYNVPMYQA